MKRILSIILLLSLFVGLLCACSVPPTSGNATPSAPSKEQPSAPDESTPEKEGGIKAPVIPEQVKATFKGQIVRFLVPEDPGGITARSVSVGDRDDPSDPVNKALKARNEKIFQELGVEIRVTEYEGTDLSTLLPVLAAGTASYDVICTNSYQESTFFLENMRSIVGLEKESYHYLNADAPYWQKDFAELEVTISLTGGYHLPAASDFAVVYANRSFFTQNADKIAALEGAHGISDPYLLVEKGYWTIDLLAELCTLAYSNENKNEAVDVEDRTGMLIYQNGLHNQFIDDLAFGCGIFYTTLDKEDGLLTSTLRDDKTSAFFGKLYTLLCKSNALEVPFDPENGPFAAERFGDGKLVFAIDNLTAAPSYRAAENAFETVILPLPLFDGTQFSEGLAGKGYLTSLSRKTATQQIAICKNAGAERLPLITATLEYMAYYTYTDVLPVYYDTLLDGAYTAKDKNAEMVDLIRAGLSNNIDHAWGGTIEKATYGVRRGYSTLLSVHSVNNLYSAHMAELGIFNDAFCKDEHICP